MENYRITFKSLRNFDDLTLILIDYFVLPVISLILFLLLAFNGVQDYTRILLGSLADTGISTVIGIVVGSYVYDQNIGMLNEINSIRPKFRIYWLPKFVIAAGTMLVEMLILMSIGLVTLGDSHLIGKAIFALIFFYLIAAILAYLSALAGANKNNPYWLSNFIVGAIIILSGVIIPVSQYPTWLKWIAELFPISNILDWILEPTWVNNQLIILIGKTAAWFIGVYIFTKLFSKKAR